MDVHVDFIDMGNKIVLGVEMVEDFDVVLVETKEIDKVEGTNFYHWTLEAMEFALELLLEDDVEEVVFKNQQKLVFEWLVKDNYKSSYDDYYEEIKSLLYQLVDNGGSFRYEIIKGKDNRAKKHLKKNYKVKSSSGGSGDLTGLFTKDKDKKTFKSTSGNVVEFLQKNRKQA